MIPVISLHQPWASLVALGVKRIETRSWPTRVRGRIAIHAALKVPDFDTMKSVVVDNVEAWNAWHAAGLVQSAGRVGMGPLGAIVATCNLIDCHRLAEYYTGVGVTSVLIVPDDQSGLDFPQPIPRNQMPLGDFTLGRFAWLLDDIEPLSEPVPFKGGQGWSRTWDGGS